MGIFGNHNKAPKIEAPTLSEQASTATVDVETFVTPTTAETTVGALAATPAEAQSVLVTQEVSESSDIPVGHEGVPAPTDATKGERIVTNEEMAQAMSNAANDLGGYEAAKKNGTLDTVEQPVTFAEPLNLVEEANEGEADVTGNPTLDELAQDMGGRTEPLITDQDARRGLEVPEIIRPTAIETAPAEGKPVIGYPDGGRTEVSNEPVVETTEPINE